MLRYAALTLISFFAITTAASAQYYPQQNQNLPPGTFYCGQHNTLCNHSQAPTPPVYQNNNQRNLPVGNVPPGYYFCQDHNQYCNHAATNDPRYTNNGYYNNGQYRGGQYDYNYNNGRGGQYQYNSNPNRGGQYDYTNPNNGHRGYRGNRGNGAYRGNGNLQNQTPPPGHYYCQTHNMFCSH